MKYLQRLLIITAVIAVVSVAGMVRVHADDYASLIRDHCDELKTTIIAQRKHDLVTRINRGRAYQTVIDQQQAFTQRLRNNKLSADQFDRQAATVQSGVEAFRTAYNHYDDALGTLVAIDCHNQASDFADQLLTVRTLRTDIGSQVTKIDDDLRHYRESVVQLQRTTAQPTGVNQ